MGQPFADRESTSETFAAAVNRGKVDAYRLLGLDIVMGAREGSWFTDAFDPDRRWLNCHCNGGVFNLGHRHPAVVAALRHALDDLDIGNHHLVSGWRARLAQRLVATTGGRLPGVVFGVSGGEIVDLAVKVARGGTGRQGVVSTVGGYHGHTGLAMATGDAQYRDPFGMTPGDFTQVPFGDLEALAAAVDDRTAAVILEAIPATAGMPLPPPGYLAAVGQVCREAGAAYVIDEIQTGLGRTGTMWSHTQDGAEPDIVVIGKGLSAGLYPITAAVMSARFHQVIDDNPFSHISTFGGAELGCVAGLAVLDIVQAPGFLDRVEQVGRQIEEGLRAIPGIELRRRGLFMGVKLDGPLAGVRATRSFIGAGVFAIYANNDPSVLQLLPPLTITDEELAWLIATLRERLAS